MSNRSHGSGTAGCFLTLAVLLCADHAAAPLPQVVPSPYNRRQADRYCIGVAPVEEMLEFFVGQARSWQHRKLEVIGAIDQVGDLRDSSCPCYAFRVWSVQLFEETVHRLGRAPKGDGFSLDPRSRSDCDWRLEVTGKVETASRYIYLRAKSVALVRREKDEAEEQ